MNAMHKMVSDPMEYRINNASIPLFVDFRHFTFLNPSTMRRVCNKLKIKSSDNMKQCMQEFEGGYFDELTMKVLSYFGVKESDLMHSAFDVAFDSIYCKMEHQMDIPPNFSKNDLIQFGKFMTMIHCKMMNNDRESLRLSWGVVLNNMSKWMQADNNDKTFVISSCHDNSLLAVLCSIYGTNWNKIMELEWPYYSDYVTFEVWKDLVTNDRNVKILYNGKEFVELLLNELLQKWNDVMIDEETYFNQAGVVE